MEGFTLERGEVLRARMLVDGEWVSGSGGLIEVDNPANEEVIATIPDATAEDAIAALEAAQRAQPAWAALPAVKRGEAVFALAREVEARAEELARIITLEQGKPIGQARGEVGAVSMFLRHAAGRARQIEGDIVASDNPDEEVQIRRHPHGVVLALTAWNYPAALCARKLGPALVTGNTFVLLAHEITPLSGMFICALAEKAGIPRGVVNVVTGRGAVVGQAMVESPLSDLVTMTGSTRAGKQIYRTGAETMKVVRLELGGKAPFIVMEDADIDKAVEAAVVARYTNCGQICTCNERMYLHEAIAAEFLDKFVAKSKALSIGDPMGDPDMGPKVSRVEVDKIAEMVGAAEGEGAEVLLPGGPLSEGAYDKGYWYSPTVLRVKDNASTLVQNEVFGPVVPALTVSSFEEAATLANDSAYGLSAYVFTRDFRRIARTPYAMKFGEIYLNRANGEQVQGFHTGWKESGLGGEDGKYGFDGYLRKQTTYLNWG
ncbi:lactaldehyde dehydrogenase/glycolaldehyde dehydrogenase [Aliiruegeria haliotis]|uniref:Lactaldehyde dehydrogenase/glycolaldehyde dehydrogenase n=1 Tax=Aliiruegeria haliotis TaxID=1280846 RepID=A0A2T0RLU5_9RHOB|nr:aldehyde dehydrogenase family protein [Aliiruegeria haliotis]PRY22083.1 lactaldehyde dehydrogenase/glycolaldehyde dehydrogenase [Aliiruegeria haliotis]